MGPAHGISERATAMVPAPKLETDENEILTANRAFYEALQTLSADKMRSLWCHEEWASCLHPGWDLILGWEDVQESWDNIFRSTTQMLISISRPIVHVQGDVGWVSCVENVTSTYEGGFEAAMIEATNIFVRKSGQWRLAHRQTTVLPGRVPAGSSRSVQ
jgi:ketosteroid isomerase-like protein